MSRISFIDVMRQLAARLVGLAGTERLIVNPDRTGRCQLRVIRRRCKAYDILDPLTPRNRGRPHEKTSGNRLTEWHSGHKPLSSLYHWRTARAC